MCISPLRGLIRRGRATAGLLAHVLVAKYADHLPLYRQCDIYGREGVELERSTLADWVGQSASLLRPLVEALGRHVMAGEVGQGSAGDSRWNANGGDRIHADDTPVPVLAPGTGKTKTGRLWAYLRDERPHGSPAPPAVLYRYTLRLHSNDASHRWNLCRLRPDRKGDHPRTHLAGFAGVLHADGYSGSGACTRRAASSRRRAGRSCPRFPVQSTWNGSGGVPEPPLLRPARRGRCAARVGSPAVDPADLRD